MARMEGMFLMRKNNADDACSVMSLAAKKFKVMVRIMCLDQECPSDWSAWLTEPESAYVELQGAGPVRKSDVLWIEIETNERRNSGRLLGTKLINRKDEITRFLEDNLIAYENSGDDIVRVCV
jgi:hypothetical protein